MSVEPVDEITSKDDLQSEMTNLDGTITDLEMAVDDDDWQKALESAGEAQDMMNRIHAYIAIKAEE